MVQFGKKSWICKVFLTEYTSTPFLLLKPEPLLRVENSHRAYYKGTL